MNVRRGKVHPFLLLLFLVFAWLVPGGIFAKQNQVMGRVEFDAPTKVEKTSGVWVDGQYVGYLQELKGSKSVPLLPGVHNITVKQDGYQAYAQQVSVEPDKTVVVRVAMAKAQMAPFPADPATLKFDVDPTRAAVFMDGLFVGHVAEFKGHWRGMLIPPGAHRIKIALPGYQTFETAINAAAHQTVEVKTRLARTSAPLETPLVQGGHAEGGGGSESALAH